MFLFKEKQKKSHIAGKKKNAPVVSGSSGWEDNGSFILPSISVRMNRVIQRCGSDEEEESWEKSLDKVKPLFLEKVEDEDSWEIFEENAEFESEDFFECVTYILNNKAELLFTDKIRPVLGKIQQCGITKSHLEQYGFNLLNYHPVMIQKIIGSESSYEEYDDILLSPGAHKNILQIFVNVEKAHVDALVGHIGKEGLKNLLYKCENLSDLAIYFINNQHSLYPWLFPAQLDYTIKMRADKCDYLKNLFPPEHFQVIPYAVSIVKDEDFVPFFSKCNELGLRNNAIEEIVNQNHAALLERNVELLSYVSKGNRFVDWIKILEYLYTGLKVDLQQQDMGVLKIYPGKPETHEVKIKVLEKQSAKGIDDFVYHEHPKQNDPFLSDRHIKPERGNSGTPRMEYSQIPNCIKVFLGI